MHLMAKERGGKCLSTEYINNSTKLEWQCADGHRWKAAPANIRNGTWCPVCGGHLPLTMDDMHMLAKERGGECLSSKYINNATKLEWECAEGHTWKAVPAHIRNGTWCPICIGKIPLTINDMHALAKEHGGRCLSTTYLNQNSKLRWQCSEGHVWRANYSSVSTRDSVLAYRRSVI